MDIYERIKKAASLKGISVNKLEKELGFPRSSISKYNRNKPSAEKLGLIADYLNVSVDYLLHGYVGQPLYATAEEYRSGEYDTYYLNQETAEIAQDVFDDPNLRLLFDAAKDCQPDQIKLAAEMLRKFKEGK